MNTLTQTERSSHGGQLLAVPLALLSSIGSIAVAVMVGWQRGSVMSDRLLMASVNVIAVLAAQLLPALAARQAGLRKAPFLALWAICLAWAVLQHASYLLAAQERAGQARVDAVALSQRALDAPTRNVPAILHDKAELTAQLARMPTLACGTAACTNRQQLRAEALNERRAALDAEIQLATDFAQARRNQQEQRRQAMDDVVGSRLAGVIGVSYASVTSAMALGIALILEGVGCLCWAIICSPEPISPAATRLSLEGPTRAITQEAAVFVEDREVQKLRVTDSPSSTSATAEERSHESSAGQELQAMNSTGHDSPGPASRRARDFDSDVARVTAAVLDSTLKLHVTPVRDFLGCSQSHASSVRDFIVKRRLEQSQVTNT